MTGTALIIIGIAFLLKHMGLISNSVWGFIWPALLVALGGWLLWRRREGFFMEERIGWRSRSKETEKEGRGREIEAPQDRQP